MSARTLSLKQPKPEETYAQKIRRIKRKKASGPEVIIKNKKRIPNTAPGASIIKNFIPCIVEPRHGRGTAKHLTFGPNVHAGNFIRGTLPSKPGTSRMCFGYCSDEDNRKTDVRISKHVYHWVGTPKRDPKHCGQITAPVRLVDNPHILRRVILNVAGEILVEKTDTDTQRFHSGGRISSSLDHVVQTKR